MPTRSYRRVDVPVPGSFGRRWVGPETHCERTDIEEGPRGLLARVAPLAWGIGSLLDLQGLGVASLQLRLALGAALGHQASVCI